MISLHDYQHPLLEHMKKNAALKYLSFKTAWTILPCPFHSYSAYQLQIHGHLPAAIFPQLWLLPAPFVLHRGVKTSFLNHSTFPKTELVLFCFYFKDTAGEKKKGKKLIYYMQNSKILLCLLN